MTPETLGGMFDLVLNLGFLYHVPEPLAALARARHMSHGRIVLDTAMERCHGFRGASSAPSPAGPGMPM
jgi:hypothetical protein